MALPPVTENRIIMAAIILQADGSWDVTTVKQFAPEHGGGSQTFVENHAGEMHGALDKLRGMVTLSPGYNTGPSSTLRSTPVAPPAETCIAGRPAVNGLCGTRGCVCDTRQYVLTTADADGTNERAAEHVFSVSELAEANAEDAELLAKLATLAVGETHVFGGGAEPLFTLRRVA